jgi:hypothetical protein
MSSASQLYNIALFLIFIIISLTILVRLEFFEISYLLLVPSHAWYILQDLLQYNLLLCLSLLYTLVSKVNLLFYKNFKMFFTTIPSTLKETSIITSTNLSKGTIVLPKKSRDSDLVNLAYSIYKITNVLKLLDSQVMPNAHRGTNFLHNCNYPNNLNQYIKITLYLSTINLYTLSNNVPKDQLFHIEKNHLLLSNVKNLTTLHSHEINLKSIVFMPISIQKIFTNNLRQNYALASQSR